MGLTPRPPAFKQLWRNCASDSAVYGFWDGSFYLYASAGSADGVTTVANAAAHGTEYNFFERIPPPGPYTRITSIPSGFDLIYQYPPYNNPLICNCKNGLRPSDNIAGLIWTDVGSGDGGSGSGSAGSVTVSLPNSTGPFSFCDMQSNVLRVTLPASLHIKVTVTAGTGNGAWLFAINGTPIVSGNGGNGIFLDDDVALSTSCNFFDLGGTAVADPNDPMTLAALITPA